MPLSRIKPQMESSQLRLDSSAASTDVNERVLLNGVDSSSTGDGYAVILEDATDNAFDGGPFRFSDVPVSAPTPAFKAFRSGADGDGTQAVSSNALTKIQFDEVAYDIGGYFDPTTNYRYTPLIAGYYHFVLSGQIGNLVDADDYIVRLVKNGDVTTENGGLESQTRIHLTSLTNDDLFATTVPTTTVVYMNGTTDYIEGYMLIGSEDGTDSVINPIFHRTYLQGHLLTRTS